MLTLYRSRSRESQEEEEEDEKEREVILPARRPYLTKSNGRLVMARNKRPKPAPTAFDLLGEAIGLSTPRVLRRRSKSVPNRDFNDDMHPPYVTLPSQQQVVYAPQAHGQFQPGYPTTQPNQQQILYAPHPHSLSHSSQHHPHSHQHPPYPSQAHVYTSHYNMYPTQPPMHPPHGQSYPSYPQTSIYTPNTMQAAQMRPAQTSSAVQVYPEVRKATEDELALLQRIDADYRKYTVNEDKTELVLATLPEPEPVLAPEPAQVPVPEPVLDMVPVSLPVAEPVPVPEQVIITQNPLTLTVIKQLCANCGRVRSRKYHHLHPIRPGEIPIPSYCRKCQRDPSSTSTEDSTRAKSKGKKRRGKKKHKKKSRSPSVEEVQRLLPPIPNPLHVSETEHKSNLGGQPRTIKIKEIRRRPSADYIIIESSDSDDESYERGRSRRPRYSRGSHIAPHPQSPARNHRSRSKGRLFKHSQPVRSVSMHEIVEYEPLPGHRSPSPNNEYSRARSPSHRSDYNERSQTQVVRRPTEYHDNQHNRSCHDNSEVCEAPLERLTYQERESSRARLVDYPPDRDRDYSRREPVERVQYKDQSSRIVNHQGSAYQYRPEMYDAPVQRRTTRREESFETSTSSRSQESARRRRQERMPPAAPVGARPWERPHEIHPQPNDEVVVVTERFTYRPKKSSHDPREFTKEEYIDRKRLDSHGSRREFVAREDASSYYHDDWYQDEAGLRDEDRRRSARLDQQEFSRESRNADHLRRAEEIISKDSRRLPRAPSPPSTLFLPIRSRQRRAWTNQPSVPIESEESADEKVNRASKRLVKVATERVGRSLVRRDERSISRSPSPIPIAKLQKARRQIARDSKDMIKERARSPSNHRPPYVREATDGGTERAVTSSPIHEKDIDPFFESVDTASEASRHVKFRTPEPRDFVSSISNPGREMSESGLESDIVEVIEEHSPPRRKKEKRGRGPSDTGFEENDSGWDTNAE